MSSRYCFSKYVSGPVGEQGREGPRHGALLPSKVGLEAGVEREEPTPVTSSPEGVLGTRGGLSAGRLGDLLRARTLSAAALARRLRPELGVGMASEKERLQQVREQVRMRESRKA